jgi:hypothetical protein
MKHLFRIVITALALTACIVALGAVATLLYDTIAGVRGDFGTLGVLMLAGLLVGQCRILWILLRAGAPEELPAPYAPTPYAPATREAQARPR